MCTHLTKRNGTYYFRRRVPDDVRTHFPQREILVSLRTKIRSEAEPLCRALGLDWDQKFELARDDSLPASSGQSVISEPQPVIHAPSLESVTPETQQMAEADLELFRVSGELSDRTGLALQIEQLPPLWTQDEYTYAVLLRLCRDRDKMEGRDEGELEAYQARLRGDLALHERVASGQLPNLIRLRYHAAYRDALRIFLGGGEAQALFAFQQRYPGGLEGIRQARVGGGVVTKVASVQPAVDSPLLSKVVDDFLIRQDQSKAMFKKYKAILSAFLEVVGDRPCSQLRQIEIDGFFELMCCLPPRWTDEKRKSGASLKELSEQEWPVRIAQATFEDGYIGSFRPFLAEAKRRYGDQGFPDRLTTDRIKYSGDREAGLLKQRAFKSDELVRLFEGPEAQSFVRRSDMQHFYWLPLVGLYTGARVNEVCQLNPQVDIREEGGVWFFDFTSKSESDDRIQKRIKNKGSHRKVPIHPKLIELGFLSYVDGMKSNGHKLLFAQWPPSKMRASVGAEKWFRGLLIELGLRDETPEARLVGFHSFRRTFLSYAKNNEINHADWLTGHAAEGVSPVVANYQGQAELSKKLEILSRFDFGLDFPRLNLAI